MKIKTHVFFCLLFKYASTQFTSGKRVSKSPCESRGSALVEQFFNVIFTEFQHTPPTCTCVQMCADHPTYCYPNGCFKQAEKKKETSPVSSIQQDAKTVFLVNNERDIVEDILDNVNLIASKAGNTEKTYQTPRETNLIGRVNPFKEIVFKYKKVPKLQIKYNLREQVKHSRDKKTEIDVSKTRWPTNKQINRQKNHQMTTNYLILSETNQQEAPKYFKRYLTKRENQIGLDISALYLYKDASNFSLETLIDNLIERGLEGNSTVGLKTHNSSKSKEDNYDAKLINSVVEDLQNDTSEAGMRITLIGNVTENKNKNLYIDNSNHTNSSTAAYFEMITTLSKQIEKQNNASMELMGNLTGGTFKDISKMTANNLNRRTSKSADNFKTSSNISEEITPTTNTVPTSLHQAFIPIINSQVKKNKQRIVRKLRNRKLN